MSSRGSGLVEVTRTRAISTGRARRRAPFEEYAARRNARQVEPKHSMCRRLCGQGIALGTTNGCDPGRRECVQVSGSGGRRRAWWPSTPTGPGSVLARRARPQESRAADCLRVGLLPVSQGRREWRARERARRERRRRPRGPPPAQRPAERASRQGRGRWVRGTSRLRARWP